MISQDCQDSSGARFIGKDKESIAALDRVSFVATMICKSDNNIKIAESLIGRYCPIPEQSSSSSSSSSQCPTRCVNVDIPDLLHMVTVNSLDQEFYELIAQAEQEACLLYKESVSLRKEAEIECFPSSSSSSFSSSSFSSSSSSSSSTSSSSSSSTSSSSSSSTNTPCVDSVTIDSPCELFAEYDNVELQLNTNDLSVYGLDFDGCVYTDIVCEGDIMMMFNESGSNSGSASFPSSSSGVSSSSGSNSGSASLPPSSSESSSSSGIASSSSSSSSSSSGISSSSSSSGFSSSSSSAPDPCRPNLILIYNNPYWILMAYTPEEFNDYSGIAYLFSNNPKDPRGEYIYMFATCTGRILTIS